MWPNFWCNMKTFLGTQLLQVYNCHWSYQSQTGEAVKEAYTCLLRCREISLTERRSFRLGIDSGLHTQTRWVCAMVHWLHNTERSDSQRNVHRCQKMTIRILYPVVSGFPNWILIQHIGTCRWEREDSKKVSWDCLAITESEVVQNWSVHTSSNMGLVNYHQGCIKDFSEITTPLYAVTGKHQFVWNQDQTEAKESVSTATYVNLHLESPNQLTSSFILKLAPCQTLPIYMSLIKKLYQLLSLYPASTNT